MEESEGPKLAVVSEFPKEPRTSKEELEGLTIHTLDEIPGDSASGRWFSWWETSDPEYTLKVAHWQVDENHIEKIYLTRNEYAACKALVGRMRGFQEESEEEASA